MKRLLFLIFTLLLLFSPLLAYADEINEDISGELKDELSSFQATLPPYVLEYLHHVSRIIVGSVSSECIDTALHVLAGEYPAKGVLTYDLDLE